MSDVEVRTEVTGTVWKIQKQVGDSVAEGDEIMIFESMKMEIPALASSVGVIGEICVEEGATVEEGDVVAIIRGQ